MVIEKFEIPEGGTLSIEHENDKCYAVISGEVEPEWKKFKRGDVLFTNEGLMVIFDEYTSEDKTQFNSVTSNGKLLNYNWKPWVFTPASEEQKSEFLNWLREEKGLEWKDGELMEVKVKAKAKASVPKAGDLCIIFNRDYSNAFIAKYVWFLDSCYDNIIKWDGTKEQYEKVLRGEMG